jgi:hypothetical protein
MNLNNKSESRNKTTTTQQQAIEPMFGEAVA